METNNRQVSSCSLKIRLAVSSIGIFVGVSVFLVFTFHYNNYNAGIWGLCSGLAAAVVLLVTIAYIKHAWDSNPRRLKGFMLAGCFIQLGGVCGCVAYLVLAISQGQELLIYGPGYYLTCVWCAMTWKWGLALLLYSRTFLRSYEDMEAIIGEEKTLGRISTNISACDNRHV